MNNQNLIKAENLTSSELRERAIKGGKASAKARRKRKMLREELITLLSIGDTQTRLSLALIEQAQKGNIKAFEVIRDTIGEKDNKLSIEHSKPFEVNIKVIN